MSILIIVIGSFIALMGVLTLTKKWTWLQQGIMIRPVQKIPYMRYMGSLDIILGLAWVIIGIVFLDAHVPGIFVLLPGLMELSRKV